jgi:hypothetical protein
MLAIKLDVQLSFSELGSHQNDTKKLGIVRDIKTTGLAGSDSKGQIPSSNRENKERHLTYEEMLEIAEEREAANLPIVNYDSNTDDKNNSNETDKEAINCKATKSQSQA